MTHRKAIEAIREILYPNGDANHEWSPDTLDAIAQVLAQVPSLPTGRLKDGKLLCPHGHAGPFRYLEEITEYRDVGEVVGDALQVASDSRADSDSGADERLECCFQTGDAWQLCRAEFQIPADIMPEFS